MAEIIGNPGRSAADEVFVRFRRMLWISSVILFVAGTMSGQLTFIRWFPATLRPPVAITFPIVLILLIGVGVLYYRVDRLGDVYERERRNFRKGADGEALVSDILGNLPDGYVVVNDITKRLGNIDHVVIGPTGVYVINTKNWRGTVRLGSNGGLLLNGTPTDKPEVKNLLHATMDFHNKVKALCEKDHRIHGLMVFVQTYLEGNSFYSNHIRGLRDDRLVDHIQRQPVVLKEEEIKRIKRAVIGLARMDEKFDALQVRGLDA